MNKHQKQISVFLVILGAVLLVICSGLYLFTKWKKSEIRVGDIIVTCGISLASVVVFVASIVYYCKYQRGETKPQEKHKSGAYIPVRKIHGSVCGICIEQKDSNTSKVAKLTCGHTFHKTCVVKSLETQPKCPICRQTPSKFSSVERVLYRIHGSVSKTVQSLKQREDPAETTPV